jgi:sugar-specific transcriptional regulator TrmB
MHVVNGKEREIVDMLGDFGLSGYEAKMYFTLLTIGEAKVIKITRKASVPQSKAYDVLDRLQEKGFVELSGTAPKRYRARVLEEMTDITKRRMLKETYELEEKQQRLYSILQSIAPIHEKHSELRLFSPSYRR